MDRSAGLLGSLPCAWSSLQGAGLQARLLCAGELSLSVSSCTATLPAAEVCVHVPGLLTRSQGQENLTASAECALSLKVKYWRSSSLCVTW